MVRYTVHCFLMVKKLPIKSSKEAYHFRRATVTKIQSINMNNIWTQISYSYPNYEHLKIQGFAWAPKETNSVKLQEVIKKITESFRLRGWEFAADKSRYGIYITRCWNWIKLLNVLFLKKGYLRGARLVSSFCDFREKKTFCNLPHFSPFWHNKTFFFQMFLLVLKLICVQIILILMGWIFVRLKCRSEEVMNFFWRPVYFTLYSRITQDLGVTPFRYWMRHAITLPTQRLSHWLRRWGVHWFKYQIVL